MAADRSGNRSKRWASATSRNFPSPDSITSHAFAQLYRFTQLLRVRRIRIVHTHDFYTNIFGMAAAALAGVPVRVASRRETEGMRSQAKKRLERCAFRLAQVVVTNADAVRQHVIAEGVGAEKILTIYNGVEATLFTPRPGWQRSAALAAYHLGHLADRRFVTIVANLRHAVKDHPTFLRAAQRVKREVPEAAFLLAGEGELLEPMRALAAELGLAQDAFFIGPCANVADLLALSDVCVLSSVAEGFSNAILEYMAAGRPVVATDVGGVREAMQDGESGHIVPVGDDRALAARICRLLQAPEQARVMGACGQRIVQQRFSCATQLARTKDLYDILLWRAELGGPQTKISPQRSNGRDPQPESHALGLAQK